MRFDQPTIVVMAVPGLAIGPLRRKCLICEKLCPLMPSTGELIDDLIRTKKLWIALCAPCSKSWIRQNPAVYNGQTTITGVAGAREQLQLPGR